MLTYLGQHVYDFNATFKSNVTFKDPVTFETSISQTSGDHTLYDATNDGDPTISLGSSANNRLEIKYHW